MTAAVVNLPVGRRKGRAVQVAYSSHEPYWLFGRPRVAVHFSNLEPGEIGTTLTRFYGLDRLDKRKRMYAKPRSKIVRDLGRVLRDYTGAMPLPIAQLKGKVVRVQTKWVTSDADGHPLPPQQCYEVVDYILGSE